MSIILFFKVRVYNLVVYAMLFGLSSTLLTACSFLVVLPALTGLNGFNSAFAVLAKEPQVTILNYGLLVLPTIFYSIICRFSNVHGVAITSCKTLSCLLLQYAYGALVSNSIEKFIDNCLERRVGIGQQRK